VTIGSVHLSKIIDLSYWGKKRCTDLPPPQEVKRVE